MAAFGHCIKYSHKVASSTSSVVFPALQHVFFRTKHDSRYLRNVEDPIVITDDGSTIVCWHPEKEFPYEYTKPLPNLIAQKAESVLKSSVEDAYKVFKKQSPESVREELMKLTFTTKHRWFPRSRDKRAKKTPMDRRYL